MSQRRIALKKTIDFVFTLANNKVVYCDVKTIRPRTQDDWQKFRKHKSFFPKNIQVCLDKKNLGGEIYHDMHNSRSSMLNYTIEFEEKLRDYTKEAFINTHSVLIFCSNGFHWHLDELEDFVDFYLTGCHNPDDQFSGMEKYGIESKKVAFLKTVNRFAYFERKERKTEHTKFICPVQGPWVRKDFIVKTL